MRLPLGLAGAMGAAGVILAAVAAHGAHPAGLDSASQMLLFHALAVLAATALLQTDRLWRPAALVAIWCWLLGTFLFSGDIALRAFSGHRLFPMAAPMGGSLMIVAWLSFALASVVHRR